MNPAATLKSLRLEAGLTQQQLANAAGLDRSWVNQMERGKKPITQTPRRKLAKALGVSPAELGESEAGATDRESLGLFDRLGGLEDVIASLREGQIEASEDRDELRVLLSEIREMLDARLPPLRARRRGPA